MPSDKAEFIFVDESGDPGTEPGATDKFYMSAVHVNEATVELIRNHLVNVRYHHNLGGAELKTWWPTRKGDAGDLKLKSCLRLLEKLTQQSLLHKPPDAFGSRL